MEFVAQMPSSLVGSFAEHVAAERIPGVAGSGRVAGVAGFVRRERVVYWALRGYERLSLIR